MNFDIFTKDITIKEIKESDGIKFINELGLDESATAQAKVNYIDKSILNLAQNKEIFEDNEVSVRYLDKTENGYAIVVRKPLEQLITKLVIDKDLNVSITFEANGKVQDKPFSEDSKMTDVIKAFNTCIKNVQK